MLFNTFHFLIFFIGVVIVHFTIPQRSRWFLLLASSCYFYMAFVPIYLLVLFLSIVIDYVAGLYIEKAEGRTRRFYLALSVVANVSLLAIFKYYNFANQTLDWLWGIAGWNYGLPDLRMVLPIGLSFHTFQAMSYTFEVYYGRQKAERHFGIYALYVMFFPQLVAGPIERPQNMLQQFHADHHLSVDNVREGMLHILWGLFKKVCIADLIAPVVSNIYATPHLYPGGLLWLATAFFAVQIYCDFSGYSSIAIGTARILGYDLMTNFRQPYFATSIKEFWGRWHISLSTWFRDYVYIPLGGNRVSTGRHYRNLLIVFALSGLWHGAAWTFVIWGALHGVYLIFSHLLAPVRSKISTALGLERFPGVVAAMQRTWVLLLVMVGWVFFRANSVEDAFRILAKMAWPEGFQINVIFGFLPRFELMMAFVLIAVMFWVEWMESTRPRPVLRLWERRWFRWTAMSGCAYAIVFFGVFKKLEFIYFQF